MSEENPDNIIPIERAKVQPAAEAMADMSKDAKQLFWSNALMKLTESARFIEFVDANYTIGLHKDEETKTVDVLVIENPTIVGPKLANDQIFNIHIACLRAGAKEPSKLLASILKILGQDAPIVQPYDAADLDRAVNQEDLKSKLDA